MRREDYERKANEAIQDYVSDGTSLEISIVKIARRDSMNPEQIKRLVEMANTGTFLELFQKTAGGDDRIVDFDVADPDSVIKSFYDSSPGNLEKAACIKEGVDDSVYYTNVRDENSPYEYVDGDLEKVASEESPEESVPANWQEELIRNRKVAQVLEDRVCNAEITAGECADKLAAYFRGIYSRDKYKGFEKNALALYGSGAVLALSAVRKRLGMDRILSIPNSSVVKQASLYFVVDEKSKGMDEVGTYLKCASVVSESSRALSIVSEKINKLQWGKFSV